MITAGHTTLNGALRRGVTADDTVSTLLSESPGDCRKPIILMFSPLGGVPGCLKLCSLRVTAKLPAEPLAWKPGEMGAWGCAPTQHGSRASPYPVKRWSFRAEQRLWRCGHTRDDKSDFNSISTKTGICMMTINSLMKDRTGALIRLSWFVIALLCLGVFILAIPARLDQLLTVTESADLSVGQLTPEDASLLVDQGISLEFYASYFTLFEILVAVILIGLALALFMIKSNDPMALMVSIVFMSLSVSLPGATALIAQRPGLTLVVDILRAIAFWGVLVFFYTFPDGKFIPRWTKWIGVVWAIYIIGWMIYPPIKPPMSFGAQLSASQNSGLILILLQVGGIQLWGIFILDHQRNPDDDPAPSYRS